jgi:signal transduction histidine kinase
VQDEGDGIRADEIPHIIEHFFKVNQARTSDGSGSGLGWVFVKRIVELHHGHVTVESTPGTGTTFEIRLPIA